MNLLKIKKFVLVAFIIALFYGSMQGMLGLGESSGPSRFARREYTIPAKPTGIISPDQQEPVELVDEIALPTPQRIPSKYLSIHDPYLGRLVERIERTLQERHVQQGIGDEVTDDEIEAEMRKVLGWHAGEDPRVSFLRPALIGELPALIRPSAKTYLSALLGYKPNKELLALRAAALKDLERRKESTKLGLDYSSELTPYGISSREAGRAWQGLKDYGSKAARYIGSKLDPYVPNPVLMRGIS
jgi:hypothetical protein